MKKIAILVCLSLIMSIAFSLPASAATKAITKITLSKTTVTVNVGKTYLLKATLSPTGATGTLTWTSSNTKIATVTKGTVKGIAAGKATITVKSSNGKKATCSVTVAKAPTPTPKVTATPAATPPPVTVALPQTPTSTTPGLADVPYGKAIIDGKVDKSWSNAAVVKIEHMITSSPKQDANHATAVAHMMWDESFIYCLVEVTDPTYSVTGPEWKSDSMEFFIDPTNAKGYATSPTTFGHYRINPLNVLSGESGFDPAFWKSKAKAVKTTTGIMYEVAIPLTAQYGVTGKEGIKVGFDFQLNDDSNLDGDRDYIISWLEDGLGWENPHQCGTISLVKTLTK